MASISSVTDLAVPKAEEHSQIDVSAYDVMGRMVLVERVHYPDQAPITNLTQAFPPLFGFYQSLSTGTFVSQFVLHLQTTHKPTVKRPQIVTDSH